MFYGPFPFFCATSLPSGGSIPQKSINQSPGKRKIEHYSVLFVFGRKLLYLCLIFTQLLCSVAFLQLFESTIYGVMIDCTYKIFDQFLMRNPTNEMPLL
jgi:hypothetical protein